MVTIKNYVMCVCLFFQFMFHSSYWFLFLNVDNLCKQNLFLIWFPIFSSFIAWGKLEDSVYLSLDSCFGLEIRKYVFLAMTWYKPGQLENILVLLLFDSAQLKLYTLNSQTQVSGFQEVGFPEGMMRDTLAGWHNQFFFLISDLDWKEAGHPLLPDDYL